MSSCTGQVFICHLVASRPTGYFCDSIDVVYSCVVLKGEQTCLLRLYFTYTLDLLHERVSPESSYTLGDFHFAKTSKVGQASPPNASTLTCESAPKRWLTMTFSGSCLTSDGVACTTDTNCLLKSTFERERGDCLTFAGTIKRHPPDDKARNIYRKVE